MNFSRRQLLLTPLMLGAGLLWPRDAIGRPLWPGARYSDQDRDRAVRRGLRFVYHSATRPDHFAEWGHDYLWCFYCSALTSADPELKRMAWRMGHERARAWRRLHPRVPVDANADAVLTLIHGSYAADLLGVPSPRMKALLQDAARRFRPVDFLQFDPSKEPVPDNVPKPCPACESDNARDSLECSQCRADLKMTDPYDLLTDALIATYTWESYGLRLGASYADVTQWLPRMRPYRGFENGENKAFEDIAYAVTHVVYTMNAYSTYRLRPEWLPDEFEFLKSNMTGSFANQDPELMGEFLDTLKSFGLTEADELIQYGIEYLLSQQNPDGSWGNVDADVYHRYHSTWTAVDGLRNYDFQGEGVSFPEALRRARGEPAK